MKHKKENIKCFHGSLWKINVFHLCEFTDIVCKSSNRKFADKLSRIHDVKHTAADIDKIEDLKDTHSSARPE